MIHFQTSKMQCGWMYPRTNPKSMHPKTSRTTRRTTSSNNTTKSSPYKKKRRRTERYIHTGGALLLQGIAFFHCTSSCRNTTRKRPSNPFGLGKQDPNKRFSLDRRIMMMMKGTGKSRSAVFKRSRCLWQPCTASCRHHLPSSRRRRLPVRRGSRNMMMIS